MREFLQDNIEIKNSISNLEEKYDVLANKQDEFEARLDKMDDKVQATESFTLDLNEEIRQLKTNYSRNFWRNIRFLVIIILLVSLIILLIYYI